jgi:hypothetical protein
MKAIAVLLVLGSMTGAAAGSDGALALAVRF